MSSIRNDNDDIIASSVTAKGPLQCRAWPLQDDQTVEKIASRIADRMGLDQTHLPSLTLLVKRTNKAALLSAEIETILESYDIERARELVGISDYFDAYAEVQGSGMLTDGQMREMLGGIKYGFGLE